MRFSFLVLLGSTLVGAAACGGKVVVDGNADKSGFGGTSSSSGEGSTTTGSSSSGSGLDASFCLQVCKSLLASGCTGQDCAVRCESAVTAAPECFEAAKAAAFCIADHASDAPGCSSEPCNDLTTTYEACTSASVCEKAIVGATGSTPGCVGKGVCGGDEWAATCDDTGLCECADGSGVLGTCQETGPFLCDFRRGCCGGFFATGE
jgi:hypothetical protein